MNKRKKIVALVVLLMSLLMFTNIAYADDTAIEGNTVSLKKKATIMTLGSNMQLKTSTSTADGSTPSLTWKSSNPSIVSVSSDGTIRANAVGTATVSVAIANGNTDNCVVKVSDYSYLAESDFRSIQRKYITAQSRLMITYAFTNLDGEDIVLTYNGYTIIDNYSQYTMHNLSTGYTTSDIDGYFNSLSNKTVGSGKVHVLLLYNEVLGYKKAMIGEDGYLSKSVSAESQLTKKSNTITVKTKKITVKKNKLKKKAISISKKKAFKVSGAQGKVTYKLASVKKAKFKKYFKVSKSGKITIKKGLKKGTYKLKVNVTAAGNANYEPMTKTVTVKVKVK